MTVPAFLAIWTVAVALGWILAHLARSSGWTDDPTRRHACDLTSLVMRVTTGLWCLSLLVIGAAYGLGSADDAGQAFLLLLLPIGLWLPIAVVALGLALVLHLRLRDFLLLAFWAFATTAVVIPFVWLVIQTQS